MPWNPTLIHIINFGEKLVKENPFKYGGQVQIKN